MFKTFKNFFRNRICINPLIIKQTIYFHLSLFHSPVCGGTLYATSTVENFYSHAKYGDSNYDKKEDCSWVIKAAKSHRIRLRFLTFDIEDERDCSYDYVELYDGDNSDHLLGRYCGKNVS